ncbi:hypothetical protein BSL78_07258 [Apostichopus japonicus]|nr:hypothetical protein BSL78_07258 [Apostichopus japonicus]
MKEAYKIAAQHAKKQSDRAKQRLDKKGHNVALHSGDRVLVKNLARVEGPGKLRPFWEEQVYVVTKQLPDIPVYEVRPESNRGRIRVLHRNLLLPCDALLPADNTPRRIVKKASSKHRRTTDIVEGSTDSSSDDEWVPDRFPGYPYQRVDQEGVRVVTSIGGVEGLRLMWEGIRSKLTIKAIQQGSRKFVTPQNNQVKIWKFVTPQNNQVKI